MLAPRGERGGGLQEGAPQQRPHDRPAPGSAPMAAVGHEIPAQMPCGASQPPVMVAAILGTRYLSHKVHCNCDTVS